MNIIGNTMEQQWVPYKDPLSLISFLCAHKVLCLEKCLPQFRQVLYKRYVDDTFLLFHNINQIEKFKQYLHLQHANSKFTSEIEMNNLSILDMKIVGESIKFTPSLYCKPTFNSVFTSFESFIPNLDKYPNFCIVTQSFQTML